MNKFYEKISDYFIDIFFFCLNLKRNGATDNHSHFLKYTPKEKV